MTCFFVNSNPHDTAKRSVTLCNRNFPILKVNANCMVSIARVNPHNWLILHLLGRKPSYGGFACRGRLGLQAPECPVNGGYLALCLKFSGEHPSKSTGESVSLLKITVLPKGSPTSLAGKRQGSCSRQGRRPHPGMVGAPHALWLVGPLS